MFSWLWKRGVKHTHLDKLIERILALPADSELEDKQFCLNEKDMIKLCKAARDALLQESALLELSRFDGDTVLVGDLHGQFRDLRAIFREIGRPGSSRHYIFLGDYVDRGECGLEIVTCLLAMKLRFPTQVYLLRGNHECTEITVMFGFCMECQRRSTLAVWEAVMQLTKLSDINSIARPTDVNPAGAGLLVDLLWSDPCTYTAGWCHSPRGVSYNFGLGAVREFMGRTGVRSIVRAHMMQAEGYEVLGNHEVITVFSAVNYRGSGNTGAVLVLDADHNMLFRTFLPPQGQLESPAGVLDAGPALDAQEQPQQLQQQKGDSLGVCHADSPSAEEVEEVGRFPVSLDRSSPPCVAAGPPLLRTSSSQLVADIAQEEVAEDSQVVLRKQPSDAKELLTGNDETIGGGTVDWGYAVPAAASAVGADGVEKLGGAA